MHLAFHGHSDIKMLWGKRGELVTFQHYPAYTATKRMGEKKKDIVEYIILSLIGRRLYREIEPTPDLWRNSFRYSIYV